MAEFFLAAASALWLGVLTSISPCPLATNIAAISYIGRRVDSARQVFLAGLLYTAGRTLVYTVLAALLVSVLASSKLAVSAWLQKYMNMLLGPVLVVVALMLLDVIRLSFAGSGVSEKMQKRVDALGVWGAMLLGVVFALTFCPVSAALFFFSVLGMVGRDSTIVLPSIYGVGTALPVMAFAVIIAFSVQSLGKAFNRLSQFEWWARRITAVVFLAIGVHFTVKFCFGMTPFWDPWVQAAIELVPAWRQPE